MSGMTLIIVSSIMVMFSMTPLKVSFLVTMTSIMVSMQMYWTMNSIFPSTSMVISFSSGMMILFCYCAMLTSYESKNKKEMAIFGSLLVMSTTLMMSTDSQEMSNPTKSKMSMSSSSPFILLAMIMVILCMVGVNKIVFDPTKPLVTSY